MSTERSTQIEMFDIRLNNTMCRSVVLRIVLVFYTKIFIHIENFHSYWVL